MPSLSELLLASSRAAPNLSPDIHMAIASTSPDHATAIDTAQQVQGFNDANLLMQALSQQPPDVQNALWAKLPQDQQRQLAGLGYTAPTAVSTGGHGWLSRFSHDVAGVIGAVTKPVAPMLHALGTPLRDVQHDLRMVYDVYEQKGFGAALGAALPYAAGAVAGAVAAPFTGGVSLAAGAALGGAAAEFPARFIYKDSWKRTEKGDAYFRQDALQSASVIVGDDQTKLGYARQLASGRSAEAIVADLPKDQQEDAYTALNSPEVKQAAQRLQDGKMSLGRLLVPEGLMVSHPGIGHAISGLIDGVADWMADPVIGAGEVVKDLKTIPYIVRDAADVDRVLNKPNVQRFIAHAADLAQRPDGYAQLIRQMPQLGNVVRDWSLQGISTQEEIADWLRSQKGMEAIFSGRMAGHLVGGSPVMPNLSAAGVAKLSAKETLSKAIDFAADAPFRTLGLGPTDVVQEEVKAGLTHPLVRTESTIARQVRNFFRRAPMGEDFDPTSPDSATIVQRLGDAMGLSRARVDNIVDTWLRSTDLGAQRQILKGMIHEAAGAAGLLDDPAAKEAVDRWLSRMDDLGEARGAVYSARNIAGERADRVIRNGEEVASPLLAQDLQPNWSIPDFKQWRALANRQTFMGKVLNATVQSEAMDKMIQRTWKPMQLLRPGFFLRTGGEELVGQFLREGVIPTIRARLAATSMRAAQAEEAVSPVVATVRRWAGQAPPAPEDTAGSWFGRVLGTRTNRAFTNVTGKLAGSEYVDAAQKLADKNGFWMIPSEISSVERGYDALDEAHGTVKIGGRVSRAMIVPTGAYKEYLSTESRFVDMWHRQLEKLAADPLGKVALQHLEDPDAVQKVADAIDAPEFAAMRARSSRSKFLSDGRQVGVGGVTDRMASEDWARSLLDHAEGLVSDGQGRFINVGPEGEAPSGFRIFRQHEPGEAIPSPESKPHGLYYSLHEGEGPFVSPHTEAGTAQTEHIGTAINPLEVPEVTIRHKRFGFLGSGPASSGVSALKQLTTPEEFERLRTMSKDDLIQELTRRFPGPDYSQYYDAYELLEAYGAQLARDAGYDAIIQRDTTTPEFSEYVALKSTAVSRGAKAPTLHAMLQNGDVPTVPTLGQIPEAFRPPGASGPEMMMVAPNKIREIQSKGFENIVAKPMDWLARQPMFIHNYAVARREIQPFVDDLAAKGLLQGDQIESHLHDLAQERAINATLPFIHDPQLRSQFAVATRNLFPFWFAQEQFVKRWATTFVHSPESFRQAQLAMEGLRHSGFVHTDDQGNDYFFYPGTGVALGVINKASSLLLGRSVSLPVPIGLRGDLKYVTPGFEHAFVPGAGPLISIPLSSLTRRFPELAPLEASLLTERGAGQAIWKQLAPASLSRVVDALVASPEKSPQMASAVFQAAQFLEATGHGLPETATPEEKQQYIDRVTNWARNTMFLRAIYGFSAPASPTTMFDGGDMNQDLGKLLSAGIPIDQAIKLFMQKHPDATAYTVFQSKGTGGLPLPATKDALDYMEKNYGFFKAYPQIAGALLPYQSKNPGFDQATYREQMRLGMRERKSPSELINQLTVQNAAQTYYAARDARDKALANAGDNPVRKQKINQKWTQFSQEFLNMHPLFAEQMMSGESRQKKAEAINQLRQAIQDPRYPNDPGANQVKELMTAYDAYLTARNKYLGRTDTISTLKRKQIDERFIAWVVPWLQDNPSATPTWNSLLRPTIETSQTLRAYDNVVVGQG